MIELPLLPKTLENLVKTIFLRRFIELGRRTFKKSQLLSNYTVESVKTEHS